MHDTFSLARGRTPSSTFSPLTGGTPSPRGPLPSVRDLALGQMLRPSAREAARSALDFRRPEPSTDPSGREEVLDAGDWSLDLGEEPDDALASVDAAVRATLPALRREKPLGDRELAATLGRVRAVRLKPRSERQIRRFVAGHIAVPDASGRMLTVTRAAGATLCASIGVVLEEIVDLRPSPAALTPIVDLRVAVGCSARDLGVAMLAALGTVPGSRKTPDDDLGIWKLVKLRLSQRGTRVVRWDLHGPECLARGSWIREMEAVVLGFLLVEGYGRLFVCTGPWQADRLFPNVTHLKESVAVTDDEDSHAPAKLLVDAIEEMAIRAGLSLDVDLRRDVVPRLVSESRSIKVQLHRGVLAVARALAPTDAAGTRLPPSPTLAERHFRFAARGTSGA